MFMEKVVVVASYLFDKYRSVTGKVIDERKLQNLMYLAQRESLAISNKPLFVDCFEGQEEGPTCSLVRETYTIEGIVEDHIKVEHKEISDYSKHIVDNIVGQYVQFDNKDLYLIIEDEVCWKNSRLEPCDCQVLNVDDIRKDAEKIRPFDHTWGMYYDEFDDLEDDE